MLPCPSLSLCTFLVYFLSSFILLLFSLSLRVGFEAKLGTISLRPDHVSFSPGAVDIGRKDAVCVDLFSEVRDVAAVSYFEKHRHAVSCILPSSSALRAIP